MRGNELIKRLRDVAKRRDIPFHVNRKRGKGSHVTLYFGNRVTIVRNPKDELKSGTYHAILKQLELRESDL